MHKIVYLSLGSNLGDRAANLRLALEKLGELGTIGSVSAFYETEPVGLTSQPWFLNCAAKLDTEKMPRQLIAGILNLEQAMGRQRKQKNGPRIIDIDILLFGTSVIDTHSLTVPHPRLHERRFVLEPLAEIAPDVRHPVFKQTIRELRDSLPAVGHHEGDQGSRARDRGEHQLRHPDGVMHRDALRGRNVRVAKEFPGQPARALPARPL